MTWNDVTIHIKPSTCTRDDVSHMEEELFISNKTNRITKILNAKYKPADLNELTDIVSQLNNNQKEQLHTLLDKRRKIFDRTLGR